MRIKRYLENQNKIVRYIRYKKCGLPYLYLKIFKNPKNSISMDAFFLEVIPHPHPSMIYTLQGVSRNMTDCEKFCMSSPYTGLDI